jgi:SNF2 family DNA or RNA helicase
MSGFRAPDDKFIIISSFTSALDLVDDFLRSQNIPATRYQGDMSRTQRDDSVRYVSFFSVVV